jgi:hypothetical protein
MKPQDILNNLTKEDISKIGDILGYIESVAKYRARRFIVGMCGELKNWDYDEVINYGDMGKVLKIIQIIASKCPEIMIEEVVPEPELVVVEVPKPDKKPFTFSTKK